MTLITYVTVDQHDVRVDVEHLHHVGRSRSLPQRHQRDAALALRGLGHAASLSGDATQCVASLQTSLLHQRVSLLTRLCPGKLLKSFLLRLCLGKLLKSFLLRLCLGTLLESCTAFVHLTADEAEADTTPEVKLNGLRSFLIGCR